MKQDDYLGGGLAVGVCLFLLTACSFEKPNTEADEVAQVLEARNGIPNNSEDSGAVLKHFDAPEFDFGAGQRSFSASQLPADPSVEASSTDVDTNDGDTRPESCAVATTRTGTLAEARAIYQQVCASYPRPDCDPAEGGGFQCASQQIGGDSPEWVSNKEPIASNLLPEPEGEVIDIIIQEPNDPEPQEPSGAVLTVQVEDAPVNGDWRFVQSPAGYEGSGAYIWIGRNNFFLTEAGDSVLAYEMQIETAGQYEVRVRSHIDFGPGQTPESVRNDLNNDVFLRVNGGAWTKVSHQTRGVWANTNPLTVSLPRGAVSVQLSGRSQYFVVDSITATPVEETPPINNSQSDLYALHYDVCPDPDDIQAMVANHMVTDKLGLPNVLGVIGTCGREIASRYDDDGELLFNQLHPDGLNAATNYSGSVVAAANQWEETLNAGFRVLVAEGGQSDFTADVVRRIPSSLRSAITVVQHSHGNGSYNEGFTSDANLAFLINNVNYVRVDNGNVGGNNTANLASWQHGLQDPDPFIDVVLDSKYSRYWVAAFNELSPYCRPQSYQCRIDFSDSVELLYLVGDTTTTNILNFANTYKE